MSNRATRRRWLSRECFRIEDASGRCIGRYTDEGGENGDEHIKRFSAWWQPFEMFIPKRMRDQSAGYLRRVRSTPYTEIST
jgi:hypothetical protein